MKIILCNKAGFCMGVRRAMNIALDLANQEKCPVYTHGPLIHNPQVVELLRHKGVKPLPEQALINLENNGDNPESSPELPPKEAAILIRAHGISPIIRHNLEKTGHRIVDGTCPKVIAVQKIISKAAENGDFIVIIGDHGHPEVTGLQGFAGKRVLVVASEDELHEIPDNCPVTVVSQTTNSSAHFEKLSNLIRQKSRDVKVYNTICRSTWERQSEVLALTEQVDAMVVVGGHNSGNTRRLAEVVDKAGKPAFLVETAAELEDNRLNQYSVIGITAGASTPNWLINRVVMHLNEMSERSKPLLLRMAWSIMRFLADSNLLIAAGAGSLSLACQKLFGISPPSRRLAAIALLYIFSMHVLHRFIDRESFSLNEPHRNAFFTRNQGLFLTLASLSMGFSLYFAFVADIRAGILLTLANIMGLVYNFRVFPLPGRYGWNIGSLESLPASKTLFIALAWATVTALLPAMSYNIPVFSLLAAAVFAVSALLVFMRQLFFDLRDVQGDRVVGKETLPIVFGNHIAELTLLYSPFVIILIILSGYASKLFSSTSLILIPVAASGWLYLWLHRNKKTFSELKYEIIVDSVFLAIAPMIFFLS